MQHMRDNQPLPYPFQKHSMQPDGNLVVLYIVHTYRYTKHGSQGYQIRSDMSIADSTMVSPQLFITE